MTKKTNSYHHGNLRQAMLKAAAEVLTEKGLSGLTLRACARQAGVSHAAPAHHFDGLKGLQTAIAAESFLMLAAVAEEIYEKYFENAEVLLEKFAVSYAEFAKANPERFRLMFRRDILDTEDQGLCDAENRTYSTFIKVVHVLRGEQPTTLADFREGRMPEQMYLDVSLYWSTLHGFAHLNIENQWEGYGEIMGTDQFESHVWTSLVKRLISVPSKN